MHLKIISYSISRIALITILLAVLDCSCTRSGELQIRAESDEAYNALFMRTNGWTGGDVACTVTLSDSLTLWLFGDSWIGPVVGNRHQDAAMINNAVAFQHGKAVTPDKLEFYFGQSGGRPASLFLPPDGRGFFWLTGGGILTRNGLFLFATQIVKIDGDSSVFGFEGAGNYIFSIRNPMEEPFRWQTEMVRTPFYDITADGSEISFGAPQFTDKGFVYIYGTCFRKSDINRYMILARVPENDILQFNRWEFYTDGKWQPDFRKAGWLCDRFGAEYSVSWHPGLKKYITIYSELGMSEKIIMRTSARPEGPWSGQQVIYNCPEAAWDKDYFCYAARAHPELSGPDELLVSYVCNSTDFWKMAGDARIYVPKFIRIKF
ncbi:MAG: DUF4185 domain-containing protein [Bacteroidota bacterium]